MNDLEKIATIAYYDELDTLFKLAELDGTLDEDFSMEKRAMFDALSDAIGEEGLEVLDKVAMEQVPELALFEKDAQYGAIAKLLGGVGRLLKPVGRAGAKLTELGGRAAARGKMAPRGFMKAMGRRGMSPQRAQVAWRGYQKMGPVGYARSRRLLAPARAAAPAEFATRGLMSAGEARRAGQSMRMLRGGGARAAAGKGARKAAPRAPAAPSRAQAAKAMGGLWPSVKSGLLWGGGFGLGQRVLAPAEQPQVVLGEY